MLVKTSELTGASLDWAVEEAMGYGARFLEIWLAGGDMKFAYCEVTRNYSENWGAAGPIIERELHNLFKWNQLDPAQPEMWCGVHNRRTDSGIYAINVDGPTPLIAAMRCFVASKIGDTVEVPDELTNNLPTGVVSLTA